MSRVGFGTPPPVFSTNHISQKDKPMPFGLDIKSLIVGIILALYVYPLIMRMISSRRVSTSPAA